MFTKKTVVAYIIIIIIVQFTCLKEMYNYKTESFKNNNLQCK